MPHLPCFTLFFFGFIKILSQFFSSRYPALKQCLLNIGENYHGQLSLKILLYFQYNNAVDHLLTVAFLNMLLCFQSKISFNQLFWLLILIQFCHFTFLNEIFFCQPLYQSSVCHVSISTTYYHEKCVLVYKLKDFR